MMKKMTWIAFVLAAAAGCAGVSQSGKQAQEKGIGGEVLCAIS